MKTSNIHRPMPPKFTDVSRFTRWVNQLDEKDEILTPVRRKSKWLFFLGFLFLVFSLSFILFPTEWLSSPELGRQSPVDQSAMISPFEMSADSFENLLKQHIHENDLRISEGE